jgi:hypothetical protein
LVLYDSSGKAWQQKISLSARETQRLSIRSLLQQAGLSGTVGGIKIDMAKGARYLDSAHLLFDESGGFSAIMKMFKHDPSTTLLSRSFGGVKDWTTRAPMLALSNPDPALGFPAGTTLQPKVFIRNTSGKTFTAHIRFNWRSATTSGKSAPLDLAFKANETQVIDVAALQAQKLLPADAHWAAVILSASVLPEELLAVAASYDQTGRYGTQTPFSDQLASHWEAGKWEVDTTHNSLVTVSDGGNQAARAQLTILYNQGSGQYQVEQTLAPDEQLALDFGKLIRDQVPDKNGHTLPPGLKEGTYRLLDLNDAPLGNLYEGKVIVDKTYGHASYNCMICCGPNNPSMQFDPLWIAVNGSASQAVQALNSCSGQLVTITSYFPTWWTDNTSIATATASAHQINGVAPGTTYHNAQSINMYWGPRADSGGSDCPLSQEQPSAPTNVTPTVSITGALNFAFVGSDPTVPKVLQQAVGNPTGGTYSWTASPSSRISFDNPSADVVHMSGVNSSTSVGDTTITVNYTLNGKSANPPATLAVTSRLFKFLVLKTTISVPPGSGKYGYDYRLTYDVYTNPGGQLLQPGFSGITVLETVSVVSTNMSGATTHTGGGPTDPNSEFGDRLALISNAPIPSGVDEVDSQDLAVGGFFNRNNTLHYTATTVTVTNNGPTS